MVRGNPVYLVTDATTNDPQLLLRLVDSGRTQQSSRVIFQKTMLIQNRFFNANFLQSNEIGQLPICPLVP